MTLCRADGERFHSQRAKSQCANRKKGGYGSGLVGLFILIFEFFDAFSSEFEFRFNREEIVFEIF